MIKDMSVCIYRALAVCQEVGWVPYMDSHSTLHAKGQGHFMGAEAVTKCLGTLTEGTQIPGGPAGTQARPCGISSKSSSVLSSTWLFGRGLLGKRPWV